MKKQVSFIIAAALLLALLMPAASADEKSIIFTAVNYTLQQPLSDDTMPFRNKGTIYVPYTLFDASTNGGVNLGIFNGGQDKAKGTYTLYSWGKNLTFDLNTGLVYDYLVGGQPVEIPGAVIRNGTVYVPGVPVSEYFGLETFQTYVTLGGKSYPLLRVMNDNPGLDNSKFLSSATSSMTFMLNEYFRGANSQTPSGGSLGPPASPSPSPVETPGRGVVTYLAIRCDTGGDPAAILEQLNNEGRPALLLFRPEDLLAQDDLIRQAVGQGCGIGLLVPGTSAAAARASAEAGNRLLERIALLETRIILADGADGAVMEELATTGYYCWRGNLDGVPGGRSWTSTAAAVTRAMEGRESAIRLTMDDSKNSALALSRVLRAIREEGYRCRLAVETEF